jgi:sugar phosphate permease
LAGWLIAAFGVREVFIVAGIAAFIAFLSLFPTVYKEQLKILRDPA